MVAICHRQSVACSRPTTKGILFMRQKYSLRLLSSAALAAVLMLAGAAQAATPEAKPAAAESVKFDASDAQSFSGAFLAARTADVDHDYANAIALYRKALSFDAAN